jgi:hypothetical protein
MPHNEGFNSVLCAVFEKYETFHTLQVERENTAAQKSIVPFLTAQVKSF